MVPRSTRKDEGMSAEHSPGIYSTVAAPQAQFDLDAILCNWRFLAALAWEGYLSHGRGLVEITVTGDDARALYCGATHGTEPAGYVDSYDPHEQLVLVVHHQQCETAYLLGGYPSPPRCFARASARMMKATVH